MIYPGGLSLSQFSSKDKYEQIKYLPEKVIETSYKFIDSKTSTGKQRSCLKVETPFLVFSRFINSADKEKLQSLLKKALKGMGFHSANYGK